MFANIERDRKLVLKNQQEHIGLAIQAAALLSAAIKQVAEQIESATDKHALVTRADVDKLMAELSSEIEQVQSGWKTYIALDNADKAEQTAADDVKEPGVTHVTICRTANQYLVWPGTTLQRPSDDYNDPRIERFQTSMEAARYANQVYPGLHINLVTEITPTPSEE